MKQNKFKIVIPSYNNEKWIEPNLASVLNQTYTNYDVLYIDDASTDKTYNQALAIVGDLPNWKVVRNNTNMRRGYNLNPYNPLIIDFMESDNDILLFVDGDDWLYEETTLEKLNKLYNDKNYWMTYGSFICYPTAAIGNPQNTPYSNEVHMHNGYRRDTWRASHLRTFKWHLYKQIKKEDLIYTKTGEYYYHAEDLATSFPCLEMCPTDKIGVVPFLTYVYNVSQDNRDRVENDKLREPGGYQYELGVREQEVRNKKPYKTIYKDYSVINVLGGGLGNMMFQTAAGLAVAKRQGYKLLLDPRHTGVLHKKPLEYKKTIFKNIEVLDVPIKSVCVAEKAFTYDTLDLPDYNIQLTGYFQSFKYFQEYASNVKDLYSPCTETVSELFKKYPIIKEQVVSLHVRRGDYVNLSNHHHNLAMDYYLNAIDYFKGYKFLVFSDDIAWCKDNFKGDNFVFIDTKDDVTDLYLMSLCKHNIIANSTFSWWGAWLNNNANKVVVYPNKWFGPANSEYKTKDLFPDEWICLSEDVPKMEVNLIDDAFRHVATDNGRYSHVFTKISKHIKYVRDLTNYDGITLFTDSFLLTDACHQVNSKHKIGWLMESSAINPTPYANFEHIKDNYDFTLTHDPELLAKYPDKTKYYPIGGCWIKEINYGLHTKSKDISMIYSNKTQVEGHILRHKIAECVKGVVDLYGRGTPNPIEHKEDALVDYRYSIIIENTKQQNYITEKIIDCLIVGTIPVYWGCPNISDYFDMDGIIAFNTLEELEKLLPTLTKELYESKLKAIKKNIELSKDYCITEDWLYENVFKQLT